MAAKKHKLSKNQAQRNGQKRFYRYCLRCRKSNVGRLMTSPCQGRS